MLQARPKSSLELYEVLIESARSLGRAIEMTVLLDEILTSAQQVMGAEACSILLPDESTGELIIHSAQGDTAPLLNAMRIPRGAGIAGKVFQTKKSINKKDLQKDPDHYKGVDKKTGFITRSMLTIPLINAGECIGVMQALNPIERENFDDQDEKAFDVFGTLIVSALLRMKDQQQKIHQAKAAQELDLAREIQSSFLPENHQSYSTGQVRMAYFPALAVGGDFCLSIPLDGGRLFLCLGDVSGKGVPGALTMARATAKMQALARELDEDLGAWVSIVNEELYHDLKSGRFIAVTFMLANPRDESLQVCNAGQFAPLRSNGEAWEQVDLMPQLPLGILQNHTYQASKFPIEPGELWLCYSDGINEARDLQGNELSTEAFVEMLPLGQTSEATMQAAVNGWNKFTGNQPAHDDATLLLLDWRSNKPADDFYMMCKLSELPAERNFMERWSKYAGFDDVTVGQIILACDEATTNVYRYAYDGKPGPLHFHVDIIENSLVIEITDYGKPAEVEKIKGRDLTDLRPGGLGTFLLSQVFDSVEYQPGHVGTLLRLRKEIP